MKDCISVFQSMCSQVNGIKASRFGSTRHIELKRTERSRNQKQFCLFTMIKKPEWKEKGKMILNQNLFG